LIEKVKQVINQMHPNK